MTQSIIYLKKILFLCLILGLISAKGLPSQEISQNTNLMIHDSLNIGMFATFSLVLATLHLYEEGNFAGVKVDLNSGFYLDPDRGPNWWEYFFEPIALGDQDAPTHSFSIQEGIDLVGQGFQLPRYRLCELVQRYVHIKPDIQREVDAFTQTYFNDHFVIGVHHRGTDKVFETPIVSYAKTRQTIDQIIRNLTGPQRRNFKIYVATDDHYFLVYLSTFFPNQVIYNNFVRSVDGWPLHYFVNKDYYSSNYQKGKEALLDCLLLSKCQILVRPASSSLSFAAMNFSPHLYTISLN